MAQVSQPLQNAEHDDLIHGIDLDYFARYLATCSADGTVKIYLVEDNQKKHLETLRGHEGPVWDVAWAHPRYGKIVASAGYDGRVLIWRMEGQQWTKAGDLAHHSESINSISWASHGVKCLLAAASSDGHVSIFQFQDSTKWGHTKFPAHGLSVNGISWGPDTTLRNSGSTGNDGRDRKFVTCGSDKLVKIWRYNPTTSAYEEIASLAGHKDLVRDVAWSPSMLSKSYIASASQDQTVRIWTSAIGSAEGEWTSVELTFEVAIQGVWWSHSGNALSISTADNRVSVWKEKAKGSWELFKTVEE